MTGELHALSDVALSRVALLADLDVESSHLLAEAFELAELGECVLAESLGNVGVPALDGDVHAGPPRRVVEPEPRGVTLALVPRAREISATPSGRDDRDSGHGDPTGAQRADSLRCGRTAGDDVVDHDSPRSVTDDARQPGMSPRIGIERTGDIHLPLGGGQT
jgi:hypothetical protein